MRMEESDRKENPVKETREKNYPKIKTGTPKKRKVGRVDENPTKRAGTNYDIKKYITCKRWKEQERREED